MPQLKQPLEGEKSVESAEDLLIKGLLRPGLERALAAAIGLVLSSTVALSQSEGTSVRTQTFREIGQSLQGMERTIDPAQSTAGGAQAPNAPRQTTGTGPAVQNTEPRTSA